MQNANKRFYQLASPAPAQDGFTIALDGKPLRTPAGNAFVVPSRPLADAIAEEWNAQHETIQPDTMPMTQLAGTAIDRVAVHRDNILDELSRYGESDLLCYRAQNQPDLLDRQDAQWQPVLDWLQDALGITLSVTQGITHVAQAHASIKRLREEIETFDDMALTALAEMTSLMGSIVLALAVAKSRLDADGAFALSQLDESFQTEQWGEDFEAQERRKQRHADTIAAATFLRLLESGGQA